MPTLALTRHATLRAQQRGVTHAMLDALIQNADVEAPVGGGCTVPRLSRERLMDRALRAALGATADRLDTLAVILADEIGEVVTVLRDHGVGTGSDIGGGADPAGLFGGLPPIAIRAENPNVHLATRAALRVSNNVIEFNSILTTL